MRLRKKILLSIVILIAAVIGGSVVVAPKKADAALIDCADIPLVRCNVTNAANGVVQDALGEFSSWIGDGASTIAATAGTKITEQSSARKSLRNGDYMDLYQRNMGVAIVLLIPLVLVATIMFLVRGQANEIIRMFLVQLPIAILAGFVAIFFTDAVLISIDAISEAVAGPLAPTIGEVIQKITYAGATTVVGTILLPVIGIILIVVALAVFIELIARDVIILTTLAFVPIAFAGMIWPITSNWYQKAARTIGSFALMKLIMVLLLSVGALVLNGQLTRTDPLTQAEQEAAGYKVVNATVLGSTCPVIDRGQLQTCINNALPLNDIEPDGIKQLQSKCWDVYEAEPPPTPTSARDRVLACYERETGIFSSTDYFVKKIQNANIETSSRISGVVSNALTGVVLFLLVGFSPAIALKLFDVFEANIAEVRYARRGSTIGPVTRAAQVQTSISVADLLTRGSATRNIG